MGCLLCSPPRTPLRLAGQALRFEGDGPLERLRLEALRRAGVPVLRHRALDRLAEEHDEPGGRRQVPPPGPEPRVEEDVGAGLTGEVPGRQRKVAPVPAGPRRNGRRSSGSPSSRPATCPGGGSASDSGTWCLPVWVPRITKSGSARRSAVATRHILATRQWRSTAADWDWRPRRTGRRHRAVGGRHGCDCRAPVAAARSERGGSVVAIGARAPGRAPTVGAAPSTTCAGPTRRVSRTSPAVRHPLHPCYLRADEHVLRAPGRPAGSEHAALAPQSTRPDRWPSATSPCSDHRA